MKTHKRPQGKRSVYPGDVRNIQAPGAYARLIARWNSSGMMSGMGRDALGVRWEVGIAMEWAASIRRLRQANGWKQAALAELMGVDQATVSRWERGLQIPEVTMRRKLVELMRSRLPELDRLQLVSIQASPNPAMAFDHGLRVLAASAQAAAMHDLTPAEMVGESLSNRLSPDLVQALELAERHGLWRGDVAAMHFFAKFAAPDCQPRCAQVVWTPVIVAGGDLVVCAQMRQVDLTEYLRLGGIGRTVIIPMDDLAVA